MSLFDDAYELVAPCEHGRPSTECPFCHPTPKEAADRRDEGMARSENNRGDGGAIVTAALFEYAQQHPIIFCDEFWEWAATHHRRFIDADLTAGAYGGGAFQRAQRDGIMEKIAHPEGFVCRASVRANLSPKWVYRSLVCNQAAIR